MCPSLFCDPALALSPSTGNTKPFSPVMPSTLSWLRPGSSLTAVLPGDGCPEALTSCRVGRCPHSPHRRCARPRAGCQPSTRAPGPSHLQGLQLADPLLPRSQPGSRMASPANFIPFKGGGQSPSREKCSQVQVLWKWGKAALGSHPGQHPI